ncbi:MAG: ComEC/Rec2 family competence protein, partial [Mycobacterium leprae]
MITPAGANFTGANCAIVLGAVLGLARAVGLGLRARAAAGAVALVGFVVLARPSPSVVRAAAMGLVVLAALATGRQRQAVPALAGAVLALVLVTPELARSPGFALSVVATAGLVVLAPPMARRLARWLPRWLAEAVAVPIAASVATAPLVAALSASVSLV